MRTLLTLAAIAVFLGSASYVHAHGSITYASNDALVVVQVAGLDDAMVARLAKQGGLQQNMSIEYTCTWSGIVVIKFSDITVGDRADVITYARRVLSDAGIERGVEFLHVHSSSGGNTGKC